MGMGDLGRGVVEVGVTVGVVLATVGIGQLMIRLWAARRLADDPHNVNAGAVLLMF